MFNHPPSPSSGGSVTLKVVEKVAERENVEPADLPPIADVIDPDALNNVVDSIKNRDTDAHFSFTYLNHTVHIYADYSVELE